MQLATVSFLRTARVALATIGLLSFGFVAATSPANAAPAGPRHLVDVASVQGFVPTGPAVLSPNGRLVAYLRDANGTKPYGEQVFVRDLKTGEVTLASRRGKRKAIYAAEPRFLTNDQLVFSAVGPGLGFKVDDYQQQVYLKDLDSGSVTMVSTNADGELGDGDSSTSTYSVADEHTLLIASSSTNFVEDDRNGESNLFVKHLDTGELELLSVTAGGKQANDLCSDPMMDRALKHAFFTCYASNLVPHDRNRTADCFMKDLATGRITLLSKTANGTPGNRESQCSSVSPDGKRVAFNSLAGNLAGHDNMTTYDTFIKTIGSGALHKIPDAPEAEFAPDWGHLVVVVARGLESQLVVARVDGTHRRFVTNASGHLPNSGAFFESWSPSGAMVFGTFATNMGHRPPRNGMSIYRLVP